MACRIGSGEKAISPFHWRGRLEVTKQNLTEGICKYVWKTIIFPGGKSKSKATPELWDIGVFTHWLTERLCNQSN